MTDPTQLEALAQRCERAAGPDRPLSWDVWDAMGKPVVDDWSKAGSAPAYTASVDAALTLVPEDAWWSVQRFPCGEGFLASVGNDDERQAATPALAITAAALRAQERQRRSHDD